jgi:uncharacterized membrane protein
VQRLPFVDWARGFAVIAMVLWHSGDAWLRPGLHAGEGFFFLRFVGGLAAPSFLMLAGMGGALAARPAADTLEARKRGLANLGRGAEIVVLGYALRLQTWLLDAAAITHLHALRAWLPLLLGYLALFYACRTLSEPRRALRWLAGGACLVALGLFQVNDVAPGRLTRLLQVDVLQAIGASLVLLALGERWLRLLQRPALLGALGIVFALATQPLGALLPGPLPAPLAAYIARFPAAAGETVPAALFPLCPWFAYACFGAALGSTLRQRTQAAEQILIAAVVLGAALATATSEAHLYVRELLVHPALVAPARVIFRVGIVLGLLGLGFAFSPGKLAAQVVALGRSSLRVYWFHMPFAYGLLGRPVKGRLGYLEWAALALVLLAGMWGLTHVRLPRRTQPVRA